MAKKTASYSNKFVIIVIDGLKVEGVWDGDDVVQIEPVEDAGEMTIGADGSGIYSIFSDESATIRLQLQHTSAAHTLLHQRLAEMKAETPRMDGFPVSIRDIRSNEGGSTEEAFIQRQPTDGKGKRATMREWMLVAAIWKPDIPTNA